MSEMLELEIPLSLSAGAKLHTNNSICVQRSEELLSVPVIDFAKLHYRPKISFEALALRSSQLGQAMRDNRGDVTEHDCGKL
jgi:hypothetical protein